MKTLCRRFCCAIFCCRCSKVNPLKSIDEHTRLLPKNEWTRGILEKNELHSFGVIPENLRGAVIDIGQYTKSFVRKVVCGSNHCLILFNDGQLAVFGSNEEGQLGFLLKKEGNYYNEIKLNKFSITLPNTGKTITDYEICDIGAGDNYSLILIRVGMKSFLIRFGIGQEDKYADNIDKIRTVTFVEIDYDKIGSISNVYVFGQRSMFLTSNNSLYVGGVDFNLNPLDKYKLVERFVKQIKNVYLGLEHCLILDFEGGLFAMGDNTYGELGIENVACVDKPTRVTFDFKGVIKKVSVGARHSLVLLENGTLYAFGDNSEGQCAGLFSRYTQPIQVEIDLKEKIIDIYSGYNHNLLVLNNGEMLSWGDTASGKLAYIEGNMTQTTPRLIQVLKGKYANCISLGFQMTVISTSSYENSLVNISKIKN